MITGLLLASSMITTQSLLEEMGNLDRLAGPPVPFYKTLQASSYDRKSKAPGSEDWFANADAGQYIRIETIQGRQEKVMAEWKGPGALVKIWSANATGRLRFYFDGEPTPRLEARTDSLLSGGEPEFPKPLADKPQRGWNFYYPLPFAKSLKITASDEKEGDHTGSMYYIADARIYASGAQVESWTAGRVTARQAALAGSAISEPRVRGGESKATTGLLEPGRSLTLRLSEKAASAVKEWVVSLDLASLKPEERDEALAMLEARLTFDGVQTVSVPLGHFFGSPKLGADFATLPADFKSGRAVSRLVMPFARTAELSIVNHSRKRVAVTSSASVFPWNQPEPWTLKARFTHQAGPSRPIRDMNLLVEEGRGRYVGSVLQVQNPSAHWWGEGDEKVWVDGESFPSWFGTGTEDYFGYAWCDPNPFSHPFIAQPHAVPPTNVGNTGNVRWHVMDDIPFERSIKFSLEMWHWADTPSRFTTTAFWYAPAGGRPEKTLDPKELVLLKIDGPPSVKGAIEGEDLAATKTGGIIQRQSGFNELSKGAQLWWTESPVAGELAVPFKSERAGRFRIKASFCHAKDYGIHTLWINDKEVGKIDFYGEGVKWVLVDLGVHELKKGENTLKARVEGRNASAIPGHMLGLDYLLLEKP